MISLHGSLSREWSQGILKSRTFSFYVIWTSSLGGSIVSRCTYNMKFRLKFVSLRSFKRLFSKPVLFEELFWGTLIRRDHFAFQYGVNSPNQYVPVLLSCYMTFTSSGKNNRVASSSGKGNGFSWKYEGNERKLLFWEPETENDHKLRWKQL